MVELLHELAKAGLLQLVLLNLHHLLLPPDMMMMTLMAVRIVKIIMTMMVMMMVIMMRSHSSGRKTLVTRMFVLVTPSCQCPYIIDVLKV